MGERSESIIRLDLGQVRDYTAIAVLEPAETVGKWERVKGMTRSAELAGRCRLVVDATGVGRPVVDLLRDADLRCGIMPVMITSGEMESMADGYYRAPKRDVITGMQVLLQKDALRIA